MSNLSSIISTAKDAAKLAKENAELTKRIAELEAKQPSQADLEQARKVQSEHDKVNALKAKLSNPVVYTGSNPETLKKPVYYGAHGQRIFTSDGVDPRVQEIVATSDRDTKLKFIAELMKDKKLALVPQEDYKWYKDYLYDKADQEKYQTAPKGFTIKEPSKPYDNGRDLMGWYKEYTSQDKVWHIVSQGYYLWYDTTSDAAFVRKDRQIFAIGIRMEPLVKSIEGVAVIPMPTKETRFIERPEFNKILSAKPTWKQLINGYLMLDNIYRCQPDFTRVETVLV
jgi:hypothetical protein